MPNRSDLAIGTVLLLVGAAFSLWLSSLWPAVLADRSAEPFNVWFEADTVRVFENMTVRWSNHYRTQVHPLFSLLTNPLVTVLIKVGLSPVLAVRVVIALAAGLLPAVMFFALRALGIRRIDALLAIGVLLSSASFVFWAGTPETYLLGAVTLALVIWLSAAGTQGAISSSWFVAAGVASLSITVTNFSAAVAAAISHLRLRRAARVLSDALLIVVVLWAGQKFVYPSAEFFLSPGNEIKFVGMEGAGGPLEKIIALLFHSFAMPSVQWLDNPATGEWPRLSVERASLIGNGSLHAIALVAWVGLLLLGLRNLVAGTAPLRFRWSLGLALGFQLGLHLVYGNEAFLYSAHLAPLLLALIALPLISAQRLPTRALCVAFVGTALANNVLVFQGITKRLMAEAPQRAQLLHEMHSRPADMWPRDSGHTMIAGFDWPVEMRGWLQLAGNFSPAFATFGISIWVVESGSGVIVERSDTIPLDRLQHQWTTGKDGEVGVVADTPYYRATWFAVEPGRYRLHLEGKQSPAQHLELVLRSVGPSGGPLRRIVWEGEGLLINDSWRLGPLMHEGKVLGDERRSGLRSPIREPSVLNVMSDSGWAFARIRLQPSFHNLLLEQINAETAKRELPRKEDGSCSVQGLGGPLPRLIEANTRHLLSAVVEGETRPGDPVNYPLQWQRDAAYIVVALARCGHASLARSLVGQLAKRDFFGGFGAEADAPGLSLWAMSEVFAAAPDVSFLRSMWPHIERKVALIEDMRSAREPLRHDFSGPLVPRLQQPDPRLVAWPARHGLIEGRMDGHRRPLYTTATAIGGLKRAAEMARVLGHETLAMKWDSDARSLTEHYRGRMSRAPRKDDVLHDERTLINTLHPFEAADPRWLMPLLESRRERMKSASGTLSDWTYFELAIAHQWLRLGNDDYVRDLISQFQRLDRIPGLWVFWEGTGEENSFGGWHRSRGNVRPRGITPHFWSSAEAQLLALAMLAYEDASEGKLVIGAGLTWEWLRQPVRADGVGTGFRTVCWRWDGVRTLTVGGELGQLAILLGPGFPTDTRVVRSACSTAS